MSFTADEIIDSLHMRELALNAERKISNLERLQAALPELSNHDCMKLVETIVTNLLNEDGHDGWITGDYMASAFLAGIECGRDAERRSIAEVGRSASE
jgi:hypothetical protein